MVEVSALAVHPDHRRDHRISLHLMKFLYLYASRYMGCDMLCATVHPRAFDFYAGLWGFRRNGKVVRYGFVKGALATHITLDTVVARRDLIPRMYENAAPEHDFFSFLFLREDPRLEFPDRRRGCVLDPVMTPEMLRYFFVERTQLLAELPPHELRLIQSAYDLNFDLGAVFKQRGFHHVPREFRYPMDLEAALLSNTRVFIGKVSNLSRGGLHLESSDVLEKNWEYLAIFNIGGEHFRIPAVVSWMRPVDHGGGNRWGYGVMFLETEPRLLQCLRSFHRNSEVPDPVSDQRV